MKLPDIVIRSIRFEEEYESVLRLWAGAGRGIQLRQSDDYIEMKKKVERDPDLFLVAEKDERIIGVVLGGYDGRRGMVYHLAVEKEHRRQGIAGALMNELEIRLHQKGCVKYYLLVTPDNEGAMSFYREMGCEVMDLKVLGKEMV